MSKIPLNALERLIASVEELRRGAVELEQAQRAEIEAVPSEHRDSARNLVHYLALRQLDIRGLQHDLADLGLSSLGRLEGHVLVTLEAVLSALHALAGREYDRPGDTAPGVNRPTAASILAEHARFLLGQRPLRTPVRIMVTMPSEAAREPAVVRDLLAAGMNVMRINLAHDSAAEWKAMVAHAREAERELGLSCRVQADLPGPKLRTGALAPVARVVKLRPKRDALGRVLEPARAWLTPADAPEPAPEEGLTTLRVTGEAMAATREGDRVVVKDARSRRRKLRIRAVQGGSRVVESQRTVYLTEDMALRFRRGGRTLGKARFVGLPEVVEPLLLRQGDTLVLTREDVPGVPAQAKPNGGSTPAQIHCSLPEAFESIKAGDRVLFDDGRIAGVARGNEGGRIEVEIEHVPDPAGARLRAEKGINLPDTDLKLSALGPEDVSVLEAVAHDVDVVAVSFVRQPSDLLLLQSHLQRLGASKLGIVLKVENGAGFENLPSLLLTALRFRPVGVMVARGDLAAEIGFERLSEVQEQILWLCEAAHVPVIWATQVLEGMAKTGAPTRAEVSDAAMSGRAECVMLNKGPHIVEAVEFLRGVLERMDAHQSKKTALLRRLSVSESLEVGDRGGS